MDTRLKDKVAIVTGGARGIGAAFCAGLAAAGAKIVVADILDGGPVAARLTEKQSPSIYLRADVTAKASVESLVADTVRNSARSISWSTTRRCSPTSTPSRSRRSPRTSGTG